MIVPNTGLLFLSLSHSGNQAAGPSDDASVVGKLEGALRFVAAVEQVIRLGEGRADGLQLAVETGDLTSSNTSSYAKLAQETLPVHGCRQEFL